MNRYDLQKWTVEPTNWIQLVQRWITCLSNMVQPRATKSSESARRVRAAVEALVSPSQGPVVELGPSDPTRPIDASDEGQRTWAQPNGTAAQVGYLLLTKYLAKNHPCQPGHDMPRQASNAPLKPKPHMPRSPETICQAHASHLSSNRYC